MSQDTIAMSDQLHDMQACAQRIIAQKQHSRVAQQHMVQKVNTGKVKRKTVQHNTALPLSGIEHLKRLNLVPKDFGITEDRAAEAEREMERVLRQDQNSKSNPLHIDTHFDFNVSYGMEDNIMKGAECGCPTQSKVKLGKFAKSNVNIVRQEVWPHTAVSKKYTKRTSFDNLEFEAFVAGEAKIIYSMMHGDDNSNKLAIGRLRVLTLISHWQCKTKNWNLGKSLYESIIEEVELGEHEWTDNFSGYETMLPSIVSTGNLTSQSVEKSRKVTKFTGARIINLIIVG